MPEYAPNKPAAPDARPAGPLFDGFSMPLGDHLEDLRRRLILGLLGLAPIAIGAFIVGRQVLAWLTVPALEQLMAAGQPPMLINTGPFETFTAYMQLSLVASILVGSPWLLYQLWRFIAPGLYPTERKLVHLLVPMSAILAVVGTLFLYFVVLPVMLRFFFNFGATLGDSSPPQVPLPPGVTLPTLPMFRGDPIDAPAGSVWINLLDQQLRVALPDGDGVRTLGAPLVSTGGVVPQLRVSEYVSTVLNLALAFSVAFQTPVVVLVLGWTRIVQASLLRKYWKWAVMVAVVLGAVLTPTADPLTMTLLTVPLYGLYELGLFMLWIFPPGGRREKTKEPDGDADAPPPAEGPPDAGV